MLKIIILGDIVGKIGRRALGKKIPELKKKYQPHLIVANAENLAHGCGATAKTLKEALASGVDFFTSGNHIFDKEKEFKAAIEEPEIKDKIIRPANYKGNFKKPGVGFKILKIHGGSSSLRIGKGAEKILIINLLGQVFMKEESKRVRLPLIVFDEIIKAKKGEKLAAVLVDFHGEATSEKRAFGWYADGRAALVWGTHTHTPTADLQIQPQGAGFISDLGMVGAKISVIGEDKDAVIESLKRGDKKLKHRLPEEGPAVIQGIYAEIEKGKTTKLKQILEETVV